jgi:long-chain-fatty-acid--[acyl-carrier-protein] ligase
MFKRLLAAIIRFALWLRYDIRISGLDAARGVDGALILPNHPAEMDPVILGAHLWRDLRPRPVVIEDFYHMPGVGWLMRLVNAIPMPNMEGTLGSYKRMRVEQALADMAHSIDSGDSVLVYPAGRLMRSGTEDLRAASAAFDIIRQSPEMPVLLVRTRGLIGSSFSFVTHQQRPPLGAGLRNGLGYLLLNFMLFAPRRRIDITVERAGSDFPRDDKMAMNRWLEAWYNAEGPEEPVPVSFLFWRKLYFQPALVTESDTSERIEVPPPVAAAVTAELARLSGRDPDSITPDSNLARDLGLDSLTTADLAAWLDETYFVSDVDNTDLLTAYDVMAAAEGHVKAHEGPTADARIAAGWTETGRPYPALPALDRTVIANFLLTADRMGKAAAMADETRGVLSYKQAKTAVVVLADVFREFPEERLGIMLPAAAGTNLVVLATMLAGKVPVMINWTVGDASMKHVIETAELKRIVTAARFLDRLEQLNIDLVGPYLLPLEELARDRIGLGRKLRGALWARGSAASVLARFAPSADVDDTAVVLFTSGSESVPKGVPLSHRNLLTTVSGSLAAIELDARDEISRDAVIYGFLPPFHSFGFTVTSILPMVSGLKAAYYPNPTESRRLAHGIALWRPSIVCGTPTFVSGIFNAAAAESLESLRFILVGAEKTPDALFERVAEFGEAAVLEGYGITECSPVLTINRRGTPRVGVGSPIGDVEIAIVDPDNHAPLPEGERGLIIVRGSNVFSGYLAGEVRNAFISHDGSDWYNTGDLGFLDAAGNLTLAGRLKRFVKVGGEMISLPAMEEAVLAVHPNGEDGVSNAVVAIEQDGERPVMALFSTVPDLDANAANSILKTAGFGNLARFSEVVQLAEIPLLGTGKTNYRDLTAQLKARLGLDSP